MTTLDDNQDHISRIFNELKNVGTKGQLGEAIAEQIETVSIYDLAMLCGDIDRGLRDMPPAYRKALKPYLHARLFNDRQRILAMRNDGSFRKMGGRIRDQALFTGYCDMIVSAHGDLYSSDKAFVQYIAAGTFLYNLTTCFALFVMDEPGHPVGMPFPGGFTLHARDGVYYCPVRDKEKDVKTSICKFCPSKQDDIDRKTGRR